MIRIDRRDLAAPAAVLDIDVGRGSSRLVTGEDVDGCRTAFCLVRQEGIPVGFSFWARTWTVRIDPDQILKELVRHRAAELPSTQLVRRPSDLNS